MPIHIPLVNFKAERPEGSLPRHLQFAVIGVIGVLILIATFWSGNKPVKPEQKAPAAGLASNQVESFRLALEKAHQEAAARKLDQPPSPAAPRPVPNPAVERRSDPSIERSHETSAMRPTASNYAIHIMPVVGKDDVSPDLATQVISISPLAVPPASRSVLDASQTPPPSPANVDADKTPLGRPDVKGAGSELPKESGRRLPAREGELFRVYEGTLVQTRLSNRLDGVFTGPVNCTVSAPVMAEDKSVTLVPVGSRFLGRANKVEAENQTRLAVTFKRLILPNGYSVDLETAQGLDDEGETGLKGKVDNHNLRKFGLSGAVGLLGGLALYSGLASPYAAGVANSTGSSATNILNHALNAVPTITVPEGHPVNVYLPSDLLLPAYRP